MYFLLNFIRLNLNWMANRTDFSLPLAPQINKHKTIVSEYRFVNTLSQN